MVTSTFFVGEISINSVRCSERSVICLAVRSAARSPSQAVELLSWVVLVVLMVVPFVVVVIGVGVLRSVPDSS